MNGSQDRNGSQWICSEWMYSLFQRDVHVQKGDGRFR